MKKIIALALIAIALVAPIFANGSKEEAQSGEVVYTVAASCDYPPLEYIDDNGNMVGYEIEMLEEISKITGVKFNIVNVAFDGIIAGIQGGQYDIGASGFTVTEDRAKVVDFTEPNGAFTLSIVTKNETEGLVDESSLKGKKVGVQIGTTCQFACEDAGLTVSTYDEVASAMLDLANGNLDAVVTDNVVANDFVFSNESYSKTLKVSGSFANEDVMAMCVSKKKPQALEALNKGIQALKENGKFEELKAKYNFYF
ncbi:MAG: transporter substrate-binding domain-containing protein [Candidatus Ornithospirochaeta sp.]